MPNRLKQEKSPYLMQHGENSVDWYPWCEEAFQKAAKEDKPVSLTGVSSECVTSTVLMKTSLLCCFVLRSWRNIPGQID